MNRINTEEILKYVEEKGINHVVFDFFDTVVSRKVHPEYVKLISSKLLIMKGGLSTTPDFFYKVRASIERDLSFKNEEKYGALEFNIFELSSLLYAHFQNRLSCTEQEFEDLFLECEVQAEEMVLFKNEDILDLLRKIQLLGKKLYLISDFYLPKEYFSKILKFLFFDNTFEEVFVSSDYNVTKRSGLLYEKFLLETGLSPNDIIMIGDNSVADVEMAEKNGFKGFLVNNEFAVNFYTQFLKNSTNVEYSKEIFSSNVNQILSKHKGALFPEMAFLLYVFIEKLYSSLKKEGHKNVVFCSKEGYFLKKLFDLYQDQYVLSQKIETHYVKVSRRSTFLPSLAPIEKEKFQSIFHQYKDISPLQFLKNFTFEDVINQTILKESGIENVDEIIKNFQKSNELKNIVKSKTFLSYYESKRTEQKELFKQYLNQTVGKEGYESLALVDVGWKGTIQDHIRKVLGEDVEVYGKYIGLLYSFGEIVSYKNNKEGILFTNNPPSKNLDIYYKITSLFEILLAAPHGSAKSYRRDGDRVAALCEEREEEKDMFTNVISPLHEEYIEIFKSLLASRSLDHNLISKYQVFIDTLVAKIVYKPSRREMRFYTNTKHYENFGLFSNTTFSWEKNILQKEVIKDMILLIVSFKWYFKNEWGVYKFYKDKLYLVGRLIGECYFRKFLRRNK